MQFIDGRLTTSPACEDVPVAPKARRKEACATLGSVNRKPFAQFRL